VLILTTDIGEGHDAPARQLAAGLREEQPGVHVEIADGLDAMGRLLSAILKDQSRGVFRLPRWMFDFEHWLAIRFGPTAWLSTTLSWLIGRHGLMRVIRRADPDVIVSTYPGTTMVLAIMRRRGDLRVPVASAITDLAELRNWAARGVDVHFVTHEESIPETRALAPGSGVRWVRGLTSPGFTEPADADAGRREFGLPAGAPVVVVSGGGWGVGDLDGAVRESLAADPAVHVVILCGRNEELAQRMTAAFGSDPRVHVSGFTDMMSELFAAADVLVHSTAGLTVLEAWIRGCRVISYGWGIAHIKANNRGFVEHGIARVARTRTELRGALREALREPGVERHETFAALPSAASAVLEMMPAREAV
jgi:processive 1,2-diacylglycerol beta-glucosyltransferase